MAQYFDLPRIYAGTAEEQLRDVQSFIYQLVEKLNYAMTIVGEGGAESYYVQQAVAAGIADTEEKARDTFASIKALIIKSADIIQAYSEKITADLAGQYVAISDFGEYQRLTEAHFTATDTRVDQNYEYIEELRTQFEGFEDVQQATQAWVRSGLLDDTVSPPVFGVEVGQVTTENGVEIFNKFARFTAEGIYFYLPGMSSTEPVAQFTGTMLRVTNIEVLGRLTIGGYIIDSSDGLAFRWGGN